MIAHPDREPATSDRPGAALGFSWSGVMLAPLAAPLIFTALLLDYGDRPWLGFLILMVPSAFISYGTTFCLFLPALAAGSVLWRWSAAKVCLLGLALGAATLVPLGWVVWRSSGPDSGPPVESFLTAFTRFVVDPQAAIMPAAGLLTAGLYWWLGKRAARRAAAGGNRPPPPLPG
jgi:hypothetical protein